jgi:probable HAF family extracellular repeat protein
MTTRSLASAAALIAAFALPRSAAADYSSSLSHTYSCWSLDPSSSAADSYAFAISRDRLVAGWVDGPGGACAEWREPWMGTWRTSLWTGCMLLGVSSQGEAAGYLSTPTYTQAVIVHANGSVRYLASLGGWSRAFDVNSLGAVIGGSTRSTSVPTSWGAPVATWGFGQPFPPVEVEPSHPTTQALPGTLTGSWSGPIITTPEEHATIWVPPNYAPVDLGTLGGRSSTAHALDDLGNVVGVSHTASGVRHGFFFATNMLFASMQDLGSLVGPQGASEARGIDRFGNVVGGSIGADGRYHAVLWRRSFFGWQIRDLGAPFPGAEAMAEAVFDNVVVGTAYSQDDRQVAVVWVVHPTDVHAYEARSLVCWGTKDMDLRMATDINENQDIVAIGRHNGHDRAFLMYHVPTL